MAHIIIKDLSKSYINRRRQSRDGNKAANSHVMVLDTINLEFFDGELVCILGSSGCGKSTLLRIIAGFDKASTGSVSIDGQMITKPSSNNIFVFQHSGLLPWMTVEENVKLGLRHITDKETQAKNIADYIEMVELTGFEQHYCHQLSGGMQRRAELARALAVQPEMLIMDEPFNGLDFLTHMRIREEVSNIHQFLAKTMLLVTHDINDALVMADRVVILGDNPSKVKWQRMLEFPHPRDLDRIPELLEIRDELFFMMGVNYAV